MTVRQPTGRAPAGCTIVFRNYLPQARVLAASFLRHTPGGRFHVLVVDGDGTENVPGRGVRVLAPRDLKLPYFHELCFRYNVTELSTAVKPSLLARLLHSEGEDTLVYLDPDILVLHPLDAVWSALREANIVLTPHVLRPVPLDGKRPGERDILRAGAYNLGFIGLRREPETASFLQWWAERLREHCQIDPEKGLFTDQRWIDLAPGCFDGVSILRDPACNVAYWNLHERRLGKSGQAFRVAGKPVEFFHFSGFDPRQPTDLSRHQDRLTVRPGSALAALLDRYARLLRRNAFASASQAAPGYTHFSNGVRVHPLLRILYLECSEAARRRVGNPFDADRKGSFFQWATGPRRGRGLSPFLEALYGCRYDIAAKFPEVPGRDAVAFAAWASGDGAREMDFDPGLVKVPLPNARARAARETGSSLPRAAAATVLPYRDLVRRVTAKAGETLPAGSRPLVVSKGDDDLLDLGGTTAGHFPQAADGTYAGYYPVDGRAAVAHLEALRAKGATALIFPRTSFWWFAQYPAFRRHLETRCRLVLLDPLACAVFVLDKLPSRSAAARERLETLGRLIVRPRVAARPVGVNIAGYFASEKGVGEAARSLVRAARAAGIPRALNDHPDGGSANPDRTYRRFAQRNPHPINLIQVNADQVPQFLARTGTGYLEGRYNIGCWAWELAEFPAAWRDRFGWFDEIWVLSRFSQDAVSRESPLPVVRMPLSIPARLPRAPGGRAALGWPEDAHLFLFVFDGRSHFERKNPLAVVEAFRRAFRKDDPAMLVLKGAGLTREEVAVLRAAARGLPVLLMNRVVDRPTLNAMLAAADCYVSLHRAEGFGLTLAESMALGKPVIATGYSGNLDFMTPANSYLVQHTLAPIAERLGPYAAGGVWAEPDVDHAAELMRQVFKERAGARASGRRAREDIRKQLDPRVVGRRMRARLERITEETGS